MVGAISVRELSRVESKHVAARESRAGAFGFERWLGEDVHQ